MRSRTLIRLLASTETAPTTVNAVSAAAAVAVEANSGWHEVEVPPHVDELVMEDSALEACITFIVEHGAAAEALAVAPASVRAGAVERVHQALYAHRLGGATHLSRAVWVVAVVR